MVSAIVAAKPASWPLGVFQQTALRRPHVFDGSDDQGHMLTSVCP
jgi:hypothetical protein